MAQFKGQWRKMKSRLNGSVQYAMRFGEEEIAINDWVGQPIELTFLGEINCVNCGRLTKKSFSQGYCFPCMRSLAECDMCIVKPELCHYDEGTCRDEKFAQTQCFRPHVIYLSNTSGLKVGITRDHQIPTRWIDQGAKAAIPVAMVQTRLQSGLVEVELAKTMADKTDWRKMLRNEAPPIDLMEKKALAIDKIIEIKRAFDDRYDGEWLTIIEDVEPTEITYPVLEYPTKISSYNLDKNPSINDRLLGIKGQYLIFENGVINVRKFAGYQMMAEVDV